MKTRRFFFFLLAILIGAGAGLAFGWTMMPPAAPKDAPLASLRADFKTDLALMVAEDFQTEPDSMQALTRLEQIWIMATPSPYSAIASSTHKQLLILKRTWH